MIYSETTPAPSKGEEATNRNILDTTTTTTTTTQTNSVEAVTDDDAMKVTMMTYGGETARQMFQMIFCANVFPCCISKHLKRLYLRGKKKLMKVMSVDRVISHVRELKFE